MQFIFHGKKFIKYISPFHTYVYIPALIRERSVFLSSRAGIFTKVWIGDIYSNIANIVISKILPSVIFILSVINLIKWPIKSRDSWIESTIGYYDWTLDQSDDAQDKKDTGQDLRHRLERDIENPAHASKFIATRIESDRRNHWILKKWGVFFIETPARLRFPRIRKPHKTEQKDNQILRVLKDFRKSKFPKLIQLGQNSVCRLVWTPRV